MTKVKIGDNCQMALNVAIYTAGHPVHPDTRNTAYEYGIEVVIRDNVWIGGNTVICPGVHIGDNVVIGAYKRHFRLVHCRRKSLQSYPQNYR